MADFYKKADTKLKIGHDPRCVITTYNFTISKKKVKITNTHHDNAFLYVMPFLEPEFPEIGKLDDATDIIDAIEELEKLVLIKLNMQEDKFKSEFSRVTKLLNEGKLNGDTSKWNN